MPGVVLILKTKDRNKCSGLSFTSVEYYLAFA